MISYGSRKKLDAYDLLLSNSQEKNWMLMTYYCPTHGDSGLVKPIQLTKKEISKTFLKKGRCENVLNLDWNLIN